MKSNRIFRKVSLDRLASPEQLDQVMTVTNPRGWIALATIGLILAAAIAWGFTGSLADKVGGRGILVRSGGVLEIVASASGQVTDVAVAPGDSVNEGQVVAWIAQPDLFDALQNLRTRLEDSRQQHAEAAAFVREDARLQAQNLERRGLDLERAIAADEATLALLAERLEAQRQLEAQGLVTRTALLATRQQYEGLEEKVRGARSQLAQLEIERLAVENRARETVRAGQLELERIEDEIRKMDRQFRSASQVVSPYTGRILEVMSDQGKIVSPGEPMLSLDRTGRDVQNLVAIVYVPSIYGKMVTPGMQIQISPSTVRQEEHGMMLGEVTYVSNFPATPRGMLRVLKNEQLVRELSGGGSPYEVHAELALDPSTASQYRWTSSGGPPMAIQSGTTALANVTVAEQRPISKVIPLVRRWTGT